MTEEIARLRHTQPGVALISPPPHHDIYSIEDLAQLIFDLRQVNPQALRSPSSSSPRRAWGSSPPACVKALADIVHVAGRDGGTGASPLSSIKNAGVPWELGLAETQQALVAERSARAGRGCASTAGMKTGRDVVVAALLGADEVSFGTALLLAEGCLMVRTCHQDTCPVGIATQRPELRAKFAATPEMVEGYLLLVAEEVRRRLARSGSARCEEAVGRVDLLRQERDGRSPRADLLDLSPLLGSAGDGPTAYDGEERSQGRRAGSSAPSSTPTQAGARGGPPRRAALRDHERRPHRRRPARRRDRQAFGSGPPPGRVRVSFDGVAGQSFGAFLAAGVKLTLTGEANDYVGKGMGGGRIVDPSARARCRRPVPHRQHRALRRDRRRALLRRERGRALRGAQLGRRRRRRGHRGSTRAST